MNIKTITTTAIIASLLFGGLCQADSASGMATGKRQHKPITVVKELDKATPKLAEATKPITVSKQIDKATPKLSEGTASNGNSQDVRAAYRLCPDGTMINPGEKCPEKSAKGSR